MVSVTAVLLFLNTIPDSEFMNYTVTPLVSLNFQDSSIQTGGQGVF